jgi:hypothetical protein
VANADSAEELLALQFGRQSMINSTFLLNGKKLALVNNAEPGAIIASVLQASQSVYNYRNSVSLSHVAYNSAHEWNLLGEVWS